MTLSIFITDSLTQKPLGTLPFASFAFNDPVHSPGSFNGVIPIGDDSNIEQIRRLTKRDSNCVYIQDDDTYIWGGPIVTNPVWNPVDSTLEITAAKWKSWLYSLYYPLGYNSGTSLQDQFTILSDMLRKGMVGKGDQKYGVPDIRHTTDLHGYKRQGVVYQAFANVGESMERLGRRDNGFEWDILVRSNQVNGDPQLYLQKWKKERGYGSLALAYRRGGNILRYTPEYSSNQVNRVWAIGAGQSPDQAYAFDEDPFLADGFTLLREDTRSFSQTTNRTVLFEYARGERLFRQAELGAISADIDPDAYQLKDYDVGARTRLDLRDPWMTVSLPAVRIVNRTVRFSRSNGLEVTLDLDLDDSEAPADEGE